MDPKVEIRSLRDRCRVLEENAARLEDEQRVLKERLDILSRQYYRTSLGNLELEDRQAKLEKWARSSEEF